MNPPHLKANLAEKDWTIAAHLRNINTTSCKEAPYLKPSLLVHAALPFLQPLIKQQPGPGQLHAQTR